MLPSAHTAWGTKISIFSESSLISDFHLFAHILMRRVEKFKEERDGSCCDDRLQ